MRALVTGGAGFIGSHVAQRLVAEGHEVLVIDDLSGGFRHNVPPGAELVVKDCGDPLDELFRDFRPDLVYHLAAYAAEGLSHHIPVFNYQNNVVATANVLGSAYRFGAQHFVFTSSIAAYGHPRSDQPFEESTPCHPCDPYGAAKLACEHHLAGFAEYFGGPAYTIFRPHNVFGPNQNVSDPYRNVVGIFMRCALARQPMPIFGDGTQTRSFSYIDAVADCIARAPFVPAARNRVFNVGGDQPMSVKQLAAEVARCVGVPLDMVHLPARQEVAHAHCQHELVRSVFPSAFADPISIVDGLARMASFVKAQPIPDPTECPSHIEIEAQLPPAWADRLAVSRKS